MLTGKLIARALYDDAEAGGVARMLSCSKRGRERWGVLIHAGTPAHYVAQAMADLFGWPAATDLHPLLASCIFRYEFEFVYPFADGNGRTDGM